LNLQPALRRAGGTGLKVVTVFILEKDKSYTSLRLKMLSLPIFNELHSIFYEYHKYTEKYVKIVPKNIEDLMSPIVLAHLIMGDGGYDSSRNRVRIFTYSFSKIDCYRLAKAITNIGIDTNVYLDRKDQYILSILRKNNLNILRKIVFEYMHESMFYRIGL
jgi:hypothetical protein